MPSPLDASHPETPKRCFEDERRKVYCPRRSAVRKSRLWRGPSRSLEPPLCLNPTPQTNLNLKTPQTLNLKPTSVSSFQKPCPCEQRAPEFLGTRVEQLNGTLLKSLRESSGLQDF